MTDFIPSLRHLMKEDKGGETNGEEGVGSVKAATASHIHELQDNTFWSARIKASFCAFLQATATKEQPLVMFLDAIQWADTESLSLIHYLISNLSGRNCCARESPLLVGIS